MDCFVQVWYVFQVVIEYIWWICFKIIQSDFYVVMKIWYQDFDFGIGVGFVDGVDVGGKMGGFIIVQVIVVD